MAGLISVAGAGGAGGAVLLPFLPEQVEQDEEADGEERRADRTGEEYGEILIGDAERPAEVGFDDPGEDHGEEQGGEREARLGHDVAEQPETGHDGEVEVGVVQGVAAHHAQGGDEGHEDAAGNEHDLGEQAHRVVAQKQHEDVGDEQGDENAVDERALFLEQQRTGSHALDHKRAEHDRRDHVAGHAEGQQGDERAAGDGVVGGFRGRDAFNGALAEKFRML